MLPPLSWVALFFISGLVFAEYSHIPLSASVTIMTVTTVTWVVLSIIRKPRLWVVRKNRFIGLSPALILFSFLAGILRYQITTLPISQNNLAYYNDKGVVTMTGEIYGFPDRRDTFQLLTVRVNQLSSPIGEITGLPVAGRVIVRTGIDTSWNYGDSIQMTGRLVTPSDEADYSYRDYLTRRSIGSSLYFPKLILITSGGGSSLMRWIFTLRDRGLSILEKLYPMPESALLSGILLGVDNGIPEDIQNAFRATGTTHIIAISGFNISILAALLSSIFYRLFGARKGAVVTVVALFFYVILTGASPSVIRAAIMGSLGLFASLVGRRQTGLNSLAFVAAAMCLFNPYLPWDVSFQLSFLSTLGLILFAEPMVAWLNGCFARLFPTCSLEHVAEKIGEYCLFTLAALITTFPVMAFHFHSFSWSSLITNPLVLPAQPAVMILGGLSLLLGYLWLPVGKLVSYLAWPFVAYTIKNIEWLGNLTDNTPETFSIGMGFIVIYYLVLILVVTKHKMPGIKRLIQPNLILVIGLAVTVYTWRSALSLPDGNLHIFFFENGPSENLLIRSPSGENILINAGSTSNALANALGRRLPLTNRHLDYAFLPASDKSAIRSFRHGISDVGVENLVWLGDPTGLASTRDLQNNIDVHSVNTSVEQKGSVYQLAIDITMEIIESPDAGGWIFIIKWNRFRMLIPIQIDDASWLESYFSSSQPGVFSAILLAGRGELEENPPSLVKRLYPALIIINSDTNDPDKTSAFNISDCKILTTDQNGWVHLTTDGEQLWVEAERNTE
jgi:competence protein ComEC